MAPYELTTWLFVSQAAVAKLREISLATTLPPTSGKP
jgi:hypothetical protein